MHLLFQLLGALTPIPESNILPAPPAAEVISLVVQQGPSPTDVFAKTLLTSLVGLTALLAMRLLLSNDRIGTASIRRLNILVGLFVSMLPPLLIMGMVFRPSSATVVALPQTIHILSLSLLAFLLIPLIGERYSTKVRATWDWVNSSLVFFPTGLLWAACWILIGGPHASLPTDPTLNF
jgi:hypothetical protein